MFMVLLGRNKFMHKTVQNHKHNFSMIVFMEQFFVFPKRSKTTEAIVERNKQIYVKFIEFIVFLYWEKSHSYTSSGNGSKFLY